MASSISIDDLLAGASLRVVLRPHRDVQIDFPDMIESFELPHITLIGDRFFAKTANRHALSFQFKDYDLKVAFSYAYSNHYGYIVNFSQTEGFSRICSKNVYEEITFVAMQNYDLVWDSEKNQSVESVETAILSGHKLKIALLDADDIWNIHPIHMPSFYVDKNFLELFTEQDSMPEFLKSSNQLNIIGKEFNSLLKDYLRKNTPKNINTALKEVTMFNPDTDFFSNYYTVRSQGEYLHGKIVITEEEPQSYKALKVFAEA
jgi:hypothetical protein